jgi:glycine/D-amino acid oxidase-like deaminating enzyme
MATEPPHAEQPTLLVIGGGIAGASVAYFAAQQGWTITVLDAGVGTASSVPTALLNPVRGQAGRLDPRALAGLRLSWALVAELVRQGHSIPHAQNGVLRPVASDQARAKVEANLPQEAPHQWLTESPVGFTPNWLAPGWPHLLFVPEAGWVAGAALVEALLKASGAVVRRVRATCWNAHSAILEDGEVLRADGVVWCGGSLGASWGGGSGMDTQTDNHQASVHRGGSLLLLDRAATPIPVSSGVYLAPAADSTGREYGVLGATFEAPTPEYTSAGPALKSLAWLLDGARALTADFSPTVSGIWTGSRLSGERTGLQPGGWWALAGLGSKGFLLGPLLARELVAALNESLGESLNK